MLAAKGVLVVDCATEQRLEELGNIRPLASPCHEQHIVGEKAGGHGAGRTRLAKHFLRHPLGQKGQLAALNRILQPLLPFFVQDDGCVAGFAPGSLCAQALVEPHTHARKLLVTLLHVHVFVVVQARDVNGAYPDRPPLGSRPVRLRPIGESIGRGVSNDDALLLLKLLLCPLGTLPLGKGRNLSVCKTQAVEGSEKTAVPLPAAESDAVSAVGVVEPGILGFLRLEMAIEGVCLLADFGDEAALKESLEVLRIEGLWPRKHLLVHELVDRLALHRCGRRCGRFKTRGVLQRIYHGATSRLIVAAESDDTKRLFSGKMPVECCVNWRLSEGAAREVEQEKKLLLEDVGLLCTREDAKLQSQQGTECGRTRVGTRSAGAGTARNEDNASEIISGG